MRLFAIGLLLYAATANAGTSVLRVALAQGKTVDYRVGVRLTEKGADGKAGPSTTSQTPITITGLSATKVRTQVGPLFTLGRSVGRAKVKEIPLAADGTTMGKVPLPFFVVFPKQGAKLGQSWNAPFGGMAPVPGGLNAAYKYVSDSKDGKFALLTLQVSQGGATAVSGSGKLFVRRNDGILDHGNAKFTITYRRPDQKDRTKMLVNSTVLMDFTID